MSRIYGWVAIVALGALLWAHGWLAGVSNEQGKAKQAEIEQLRQAFDQGRQLGTVRDRIVTQYVDRVQVIEKRGETIIKEVPVYVTADDDARCAVPAGFIRLHNAAATGADLRRPTGAADEASPPAGEPAGG